MTTVALREQTKNRLVALLVAALLLLLARVAAAALGAPATVERGLYALAIACLAACTVVVLRERF